MKPILGLLFFLALPWFGCASAADPFPWQDAGSPDSAFDSGGLDAQPWDYGQYDFGGYDSGQDAQTDGGGQDTPPSPKDSAEDVPADAEVRDRGPDAVTEWNVTENCELTQAVSITKDYALKAQDTYYKSGTSGTLGQNHFTPPFGKDKCTQSSTKGSPDHIYKLDLPESSPVEISANCEYFFDCLLYLTPESAAGDCSLSQNQISSNTAYCSDSTGISGYESIKASLNTGKYYLLLDGFDGSNGQYDLNVFVWKQCKFYTQNNPPLDIFDDAIIICEDCANPSECDRFCLGDNSDAESENQIDMKETPEWTECISSDGGGKENIWLFKSLFTADVTISLTSDKDLAIFLVKARKDGSTYLCSSQLGEKTVSDSGYFVDCAVYGSNPSFTASVVENQDYYIIVDGYDSSEAGEYELQIKY